MGIMDVVAVGVPVLTGPAEGWNFWPVVGIPLAMFIAFRWFKLPPRIWVILAAILTGLVAADAVSAWGILPVVIGASCLVGIGSMALGRLHRTHPPTV